ncbi:hypothetical protein [Methylovulum miyakonense]|uniref:hypothetical protein n=1 Tax=Methylovulum miyakonense TaxID=645578 RepID=UPI00037815E5|nr:hypothetical protein [Methylovulum miyakonense]
MHAKQDNYPVFEANQVLTNAHLNQAFDFLDEQERLTRANLIGIGIACGLELKTDGITPPTAIHISRGCGVTSEGYLIVESGDLALVAYRKYELPTDIAYPPFKKSADTAYPLWELFPAGEPDTRPLQTPPNFLDDKAVVLFLELDKAGLRNCSPNNCDDKGARVAVKVRRLLVSKADLAEITTKAKQTSSELTPSELAASLLAQLDLPDLRMPRFDVPNSHPVSSNQLLKAFLELFGRDNLVANTSAALSQAYQAFQPVLKAAYSSNPFAGFSAQFGFLSTAPTSTAQVRFLQYYYGFFSDLLSAYDEFRQAGQGLLCACCPSEQLFPRHLALGLPIPDNHAVNYRQSFLASAAISRCEQLTRQVLLLFRRMVEMVNNFTDSPSLPPMTDAAIDPQIRITPSKLGNQPLSEKAIPYYYGQTATPPLYQLWNDDKTQGNKANQNLSYRAAEYQPAAPAFASNPLAYDLEPFNFLRIEGHLGKPYPHVMDNLLAIKSSQRLPIDIIALRSGAFDETAPIDVSKENCRFQDLDLLYVTTREQILCFLVAELTSFYDLPYESGSQVTSPVKSQFAAINRYQPDFFVKPNTLGRIFEDVIIQQGGVVPEIDAHYMADLINSFNPDDSIVYYSFFYLVKLTDALVEDFANVNFVGLETRYRNLAVIVNAIESKREQITDNLYGTAVVLRWEEIDDRLEAILFACQLDALKALNNEYLLRIRELKKKQFLGNFLTVHPGIQHKAGVPMGGTFILVYHQEPSAPSDFASANNSGIGALANPFQARIILPQHINQESFGPFVYNPTFTAAPLNVEVAISPEAAPSPVPANPAGFVASPVAVNPVSANTRVLNAGTEVTRGARAPISAASLSTAASNDFLNPEVTRTVSPNNLVSAPSAIAASHSAFAGIASTEKLDAANVAVSTGKMAINPAVIGNALVDANTPATVLGQAGVGIAPAQAVLAPVVSDAVTQNLFVDAVNRLHNKTDFINDPDMQVVLAGLAGINPVFDPSRIPIRPSFPPLNPQLSAVDEIIAQTVDGFADGTVIGDFYLPYLCHAGCASVQFVLPKIPPTFTVSIGCTQTDPEVAFAPVTVTPKGGMPPYRIKVDDGSFQSLTNPVHVPVGEHTLIVQDANDTSSARKTVNITQALRIGEPAITCDENAQTYVAVIPVFGGTPPYRVNGQDMVGAGFTSGPIASGGDFSINVIDQNGCALTATISHTCPPPCKLPDEGNSRRCAYRLWLQPTKEGLPYEDYQQESEVALSFNGQNLKLEGAGDLLQIKADDLNQDFNQAIGAVIQKLNEAVNQQLSEVFGDLGTDRLKISYEPQDSDPFGVLWIEHFIKDRFKLGFDFNFFISGFSTDLASFSVSYGNETGVSDAPTDGAVFVNRHRENKMARVPAFACSQRNQCTGSGFADVCTGFDLNPGFISDGIGDNHFFFAINEDMPRTGIAAWVWDFTSQTDEPFYVGEQLEIFWQPGGFIKLTAISDTGCFSFTVEDRT